MKHIILLPFCIWLYSCQTNSPIENKIKETSPTWEHSIHQISNTPELGFRGIYVVDSLTCYVGGQNGTWGKTTDGGKNWLFDSIPGCKKMDLRSIVALSNNVAMALTAGSPAMLFRTENGGTSWQKIYENNNKKVFFDAIKFWDNKRGIAFSDPVDGELFLIETSDGGRSWNKLQPTNIPPALEMEAGFAASGSSLWLGKKGLAYIGLGGEKSRIFKSVDYGKNWIVFETPVQHGTDSKGIYSLDFLNGEEGIIAGGDYKHQERNKNIALTTNGGKSWSLAKNLIPYKECIKFVPGIENGCIAIGPTGIHLSMNKGVNWQEIDTLNGYHTIDFPKIQSKNRIIGWMTGSKGKIAQIVLSKKSI